MRLVERIADYAWFVRNFIQSRLHISGITGDGDAVAQVVLLPGIYEDASYFHTLRHPLRKNGYQVSSLALGRMLQPVPTLAKRALTQISGIDGKVILLGHSKGGLIGRAVLAAKPDNVYGLVAIATPWQGSSMARIFRPSSALGALSPGRGATRTPWGDELELLVRSRIHSIYPAWDPHVPEGAELDGATNKELPISGHFRVVSHPSVEKATLDSIAELLTSAPPWAQGTANDGDR